LGISFLKKRVIKLIDLIANKNLENKMYNIIDIIWVNYQFVNSFSRLFGFRCQCSGFRENVGVRCQVSSVRNDEQRR